MWMYLSSLCGEEKYICGKQAVVYKTFNIYISRFHLFSIGKQLQDEEAAYSLLDIMSG